MSTCLVRAVVTERTPCKRMLATLPSRCRCHSDRSPATTANFPHVGTFFRTLACIERPAGKEAKHPRRQRSLAPPAGALPAGAAAGQPWVLRCRAGCRAAAVFCASSIAVAAAAAACSHGASRPFPACDTTPRCDVAVGQRSVLTARALAMQLRSHPTVRVCMAGAAKRRRCGHGGHGGAR